jgi:hypothetical protein
MNSTSSICALRYILQNGYIPSICGIEVVDIFVDNNGRCLPSGETKRKNWDDTHCLCVWNVVESRAQCRGRGERVGEI